MAKCTAPIRGHRTAAAAAECPACGSKRGTYGYSSSYNNYNYLGSKSSSSSNMSQGSRSSSPRPSWSPAGSSVVYTVEQIRTLTPVRNNVIKRRYIPDKRDIFLCHAWDDRKSVAKELHDYLESKGVTVWFSEKDVLLGSSLLREIDKGLANWYWDY